MDKMVETEEITSFTKYEKARMIGSRALQLAMGAPFLVKLDEKDLEKLAFNPIAIAKIEFEKGVLPITVRRPMPGEKKAKAMAAEAAEKAKSEKPAKAE
jgi:DNA-directed RNA polymerase subunit K